MDKENVLFCELHKIFTDWGYSVTLCQCFVVVLLYIANLGTICTVR